MGAGMARCVRDAGFDLIVCDTNPSALERFEREGVRVTSRAADCAGMDAVIVLVANDAQILSVTLGPEGIARAVEKGHEPLVCLMSTTLPETVAKVAEGLSAFGVRLVDAPVSGGQVRAEDGTLTIMIAGDDADIDLAEPLMRSMGSDVFRCGALGAAEVVKLVNNMLGIASMYLAAEAFDGAHHPDSGGQQRAQLPDGRCRHGPEALPDLDAVRSCVRRLDQHPAQGSAPGAGACPTGRRSDAAA